MNPPSLAGIAYYWRHVAWNLYEPLTCTLWGGAAFISKAISGELNPFWFHLTSLLLHVAATLAVYRLLRLIGFKPWIAAASAGLFAVHPIQTEAVAFIGAMNNPLYACLAVLAIGDYFVATSPASAQSRRRRRATAMRGTLFFILALCAKPTAVVVPVAAALLDWAVHCRPMRKVIRSAAPWLILTIPFILVTKLNQHGPSAAVGIGGSAMLRPLLAMDSVAMQLWHVLMPFSLTIDYGRSPAWMAAHPIQFLTAIVTFTFIAAAWRARKTEPMLSAAIGIFIIGLLPNSGLVPFDFQINSTVTDRYAYLPMIGIAIAAGWALSRARAIETGSRRSRAGVTILVDSHANRLLARRRNACNARDRSKSPKRPGLRKSLLRPVGS